MEISRKNQEEMLDIKNTITEIKNIFYGLLSRQGTAEGRIYQCLKIYQQKFPKEKSNEKED